MESELSLQGNGQTLGPVLVVEPRTLWRECLEAALSQISATRRLVLVSEISAWKTSTDGQRPAVVVLSLADISGVREEIERQRAAFADSGTAPPAIIMADDEDSACVLDALDAGARGFIPTSVSMEVAVEAIRLVVAGGTFVPASALLSARNVSNEASGGSDQPGNGIFTERQYAVIQRLREGKANKIIAYELNMRESTVKVHIRNIMRKLKATNRTQVAYLYQSMLDENANSGKRRNGSSGSGGSQS